MLDIMVLGMFFFANNDTSDNNKKWNLETHNKFLVTRLDYRVFCR